MPKPLPPSRGRTFYISPRGSDSNPGSRRRPWRTIENATERLRPGQRAVVRAGTYTENVLLTHGGRPHAPITLINYPGERPVLRAAGGQEDSYPIAFYSASYVRVHGLTIEGSTGGSSADVYFEAGARRIELSGCEIRGSADQGIFADRTTHHLQILGNSIHDNGHSSQQNSHGIYLEGRHQLVANNLIYDNHHGFGLQIYPSAENIIAIDNTIVGNKFGGIVVGAAGGTTASYVMLANNIVAYNGWAGIQSDFPDGTIRGRGNYAFHNVGYKNGQGNFVTWEGGGIDYSGGNIVGDPRFRSLEGRDFRLSSGSAALGRGSKHYSLRFDYSGRRRPQGREYDIGAFELPR